MTTGPNTPEGKAIVAMNSVKHGLRTQAIIIPDVEAEEDWIDLRESILDTLVPADPLEECLAHRVAECLWRLRRVTRAELRAHTAKYNDLAKDLDSLTRHEAHLNRQLYQALHEIEARQTRRNGGNAPLARLDITGVANE
jgi:hypothetical protein